MPSTGATFAKDTPRRPRTWRGGSAGRIRGLRVCAAGLAAILATAPLTCLAQVNLPDFGDPADATMSAAEEREIGRAFMREVRARFTIIEDPEVVDYVQSLGYNLVSQTDPGNAGFTFFVVADDAINAFAAPGGYIGLNSGLIVSTETEGELASVVAHEIAHVTQRHIARALALGERTNMAALAGLVAAIIIGTQNSQAGQAAAAAATAGSAQAQLNFTRSNEKEADRVGMQLLAGAGYDPRAMPVFFEKLQTASRYYGRPPEFLSTHPVTTSRIADTRNRAAQYPYRQVPDTLSYQLAREKVRVITSRDSDGLLAEFEDRLQRVSESERAAVRYGRALALAEAGRHDQARAELSQLAEDHPDRMSFRAALARHEMLHGDLKEALRLYEDAYGLFPDNKLVVHGYSEALVRAGEGRKALKVIEDHARTHHLDAALHRIAAEAHRQSGNVVESRMSLAEHYYLNGDLDAAIQQLRIATRESSGSDFYRSSRLEARLKELEQERQQRAAR